MKRESKEDIADLLDDVRGAIDCNNTGFARNTKNMKTLRFYGWTENDAYDRVYALDYDNYTKGPEPDRDFPSGAPLWFFKYNECGCTIYVKFSLDYLMLPPRLFVLGFHFDE